MEDLANQQDDEVESSAEVVRVADVVTVEIRESLSAVSSPHVLA